MITKHQLGANIRHYRLKAGLTQEDLDHMLGYNSESFSVSRWENGKNYPRTEKLLLLIDALGIEPNDLMEER